MNDLDSVFTALQIQQQQPGKSKREKADDNYGDCETIIAADKLTVEGSPCLPISLRYQNCFREKKKLDLCSTPYKLLPILESGIVEPVGNTFVTSNIIEKNRLYHKVVVFQPGNFEPVLSTSNEHQENSHRTNLLCGTSNTVGCLQRPELNHDIAWVKSQCIQLATVSDLLRVHDYEYIKHLESIALNNDRDDGEKRPYFYPQQGLLDHDTPLSSELLLSAKHFCGAAIQAVDTLMKKSFGASSESREEQFSRAFVVGRPPGHHAGPYGCVPSEMHWQRPDMTSSGFCLLNVVAVAAAYARQHYGRMAMTNAALSNSAGSSYPTRFPFHPPKIAIVDIDIHHGNGTEEIVRGLKPHTVFLPLPSSWAPVGRTNYRPWLNERDSEEVLFASVHLFAESRFYPCSGRETAEESCGSDDFKRSSNVINIELSPVGANPWEARSRARLTAAQKEESCRIASEEFRSKVSSQLMPQLSAFEPDLVFISAGFDGHCDDLYHFLTEADLHWVTQQLCQVVDSNNGVGVISVLEGGYSLSAPKAKKTTGSNSSSANSSAAVGAVGTRGRTASSGAVSVSNPLTGDPAAVGGETAKQLDPHTMFAQQPGDGGLVKGVLAHMAALAGREHWQ
mmetsp:Transcript_6418/g.9616  ORF Transcript_6418/g.9616 Transcript_6418/m.9616 type:complete len:622 (+) Transcript_6418:49-1914(+)